MRIVFIGCVQFSHRLLTHALMLDELEIVGVVTKGASAFHADFKSLSKAAASHTIPCYLADEDDHLVDWIKSREPDMIFCFGWPQLLSQAILNIPPRGVIGYHPTLLPRNRGRHPIIWALALGLKKTGSTFFFMDGGADSGDIISQETVKIKQLDNAGSLYTKLADVAIRQLTDITKGNYTRTPQDHTKATYWRKRSAADGVIDWRMPAQGIYNLVRALANPYSGATANGDYAVWQLTPHTTHYGDEEPGRVLAVDGCKITVKCGDGFVVLTNHELDFPISEGKIL